MLHRSAMLLVCVVVFVRFAGADTPPTFVFRGAMPVYFWLSGAPDGQQSVSVKAADGRVAGYLTHREHQVAVDFGGVTEVYDTTMTAILTGVWDTVTPGATRFVGTADCTFLGREYFDGVLGLEQAGSGTVPIELDIISAGSGFQGTIHALDGGSMILLSVPQWQWDVSNPTAPPYYNPSVLVGAAFSPFMVSPAGAVQLEAVDPLPDLLDLVTAERGLSASDQVRLATQGQPVSGPAADGATRLLLRAKLPAAGNVTFSVQGSVGCGGLTGLNGTGPASTALTATTQFLPTLGAHYAFVLYQAPDGLPAGSSSAAGGVSFVISAATDTPGASQPTPVSLFLFQPPVVLLHGLWSDGRTWDKFALNANGKFNWTAAPSYPDASGLAANAEALRVRVQDTLGMVRSQGAAACRVDVIGHSMGGLLARYWAREGNASAYVSPRNWYAGDLRRLITLDTPHSGSPLANAILAGGNPITNWIMRNALLRPADDGAVEDLCVGSPALASMGASLVPGHALVGSVDLSLDLPVGGLGAEGAGWGSLLQALPLVGWASPLWTYNTSDLFGGISHDFVVGEESQRGGLAGLAVSLYHGYEYRHTNNTSSGVYAQECETLLTGPESGFFASFTGVTAQPTSLAAAAPGPTSRPAGSDVPAPTLTIAAPPEGASVVPGMSMMIQIQVPDGATAISTSVLGNGSYAESSLIDPSLVSIPIPVDAIGEYTIVALAQLADGQQAYSAPLHLQANLLGATPTVLRFWQGMVSLEPHDTMLASCLLDCSDRVTRSLAAGASGLTFSSTDPTVAAVDSAGNVTAVAPGWCTVLADYWGLEASLVVAVRAPMPDFRDVPAGFWAFYSIRAALRAGIVGGYPDGTYKPTDPVTRAQMAVFLVRALDQEPADPLDPQSWKDAYGYDPAEPTTWAVDFTDVPASGWGSPAGPYWAWFHIQRLYETGVTQGVTATEYGPAQEVSRDQMAVFLIRALGQECSNPCVDATCWAYDPATPGTWAHDFADIPATGQDTCHGAYWAWYHIQALYETGVTLGCGDGTNYCPGDSVRRDEMAVFLARAFLGM